MEDEPDGSSAALSEAIVKNGEIPTPSEVRVNGNATIHSGEDSEDDDSSDCDALVIDDESAKQKGFRGFSNEETQFTHHGNPYFEESIFELFEKSRDKKEVRKNNIKKKANPKLREYTQYLGLQPTVRFKCKKCQRSGFQSWGALNDHVLRCDRTETPDQDDSADIANIHGQTNIRVTRNVFLCSACGTYYENWNLFLHMREVHRRYICLYCLGMFSHPEKLSLHIVSKHNCIPNRIDSLEEFYDLYKVPCFLMCCECQKGFTESDNFFEHQCLETIAKTTVNHVTADSSIIPGENDVSIRQQQQQNTAYSEKTSIVESVVAATELTGDANTTDDANFEDQIENLDHEKEDNDSMEQIEEEEKEEEVETRKVPKVTLKLPKAFDYNQKTAEEVENCESDDNMEVDRTESESPAFKSVDIQIAGTEVPVTELELEQPLDKFDIVLLLKKCLGSTVSACVYCNHARKIAVNGKQLGLHAIAEHRFSAVVNSITAEELIPESFVARIKECLIDLENVHFNLEPETIFSHVFECFQCRYSTTVHKELYLHNRKMHAKSILLCIMCKSNFYSYSELICHLCPGLYELDSNIHFRCCMCVGEDLPSAFRLMVHLRKKHHACDVCLDLCHNQSKLSNHVWKHKLHHLCYRCGIAYRNKPDITKHLFWKHGTESVLCKKCLQKKWPHVYHFCIPPSSFACDECNLSFSKAVYLMVHKRLHIDQKPHACSEPDCGETFVSKKLLLKHEFKHREPQEEMKEPEVIEKVESVVPKEPKEPESVRSEDLSAVETVENEEKPKVKVDVYDLPELNLSESDSSDSEDEAKSKSDNPVVETIWDDFRNYQANKEHEEIKNRVCLEAVLNDHDYCVVREKPEEADLSADHDYCNSTTPSKNPENGKRSPVKTKGSSSDTSEDSESSSCTCGSNCSCSSSSGSCSSESSDSSESDSSSSEGRRRQEARRERRKQKASDKKNESESKSVDVVNNDNGPTIVMPDLIRESDLETTESDTDEDFYDKKPQELANKLLAEKRALLLNGGRPPTPSLPEEPPPQQQQKKKKSKSKKKKKKNKREKSALTPFTLTLATEPAISNLSTRPLSESDSNLRASKRRRVPNKFYGYSSDEEEKEAKALLPVHKWRRVDFPEPPPTLPPPPPPLVPPITIKTLPILPELPAPLVEARPESGSDSNNETSSEEEDEQQQQQRHHHPPHLQAKMMAPPQLPLQAAPPQPALYCYCRCPYDEVSEMIGCDSSECDIEWFHFECVGIMVPPKGQWFCPDCRKKKQQRRGGGDLQLHGHAV